MSDTMGVIRFFVPGLPAPGGSKRGFVVGKKGGPQRAVIVDDCNRSKPWMERVASFAVDRFPEPLSGPLAVTFRFVMPRPKGHFGTGKNAAVVKPSAPAYPTTKPDTTKLIRSTEDSLKGIAWWDDSQIVEQRGLKVYGARIGAYIEVAPMEPPTGRTVTK